MTDFKFFIFAGIDHNRGEIVSMFYEICKSPGSLLPEHWETKRFTQVLTSFHAADLMGLVRVFSIIQSFYSLRQAASIMLNFSPWNQLLQEYVNDQGLVDYARWQQEAEGALSDWLKIPAESVPGGTFHR